MHVASGRVPGQDGAAVYATLRARAASLRTQMLATRTAQANAASEHMVVPVALLGVAFMAGTQVLTGSVSESFDKVFADVYARIDTVVRSSTEVATPFGSERAKVDAADV